MEQYIYMFKLFLNPFMESSFMQYVILGVGLLFFYMISRRLVLWLTLLKAYTLMTYLFTSFFSILFIFFLQVFTQININKITYIALFKTLSLFALILIVKRLGFRFIQHISRKAHPRQT